MNRNWTKASLDTGRSNIHYYRAGSRSNSPLVLVHGFSDDGLCWEPVAENLKNDFDVIMPDMHGHGFSGRYLPGTEIDMASDLAVLIKKLDLRKPVVCGHSMGAMASFKLAVEYPDLPGMLVLEDPPWKLPSEDPGENPAEGITAWARSLSEKTYEQLIQECRAENPHWPEITIRNMCASKKRLDQNIIGPLSEKVSGNFTGWLRTVSDIKFPVLLITADPALGAIVTPETARKAAGLNPMIRLANIPDTGHLIRYDKFDAYMKVLRSFLEDNI